MQTSVHTVSFLGMSTIGIEVQVQILNGMPAFTIVGLPDKIVAESRERIRAAFFAMGITLPAKRLTVNLAPADVPKEGSHYDLPIALAILAAMDVISSERTRGSLVGYRGYFGSKNLIRIGKSFSWRADFAFSEFGILTQYRIS